MLSYDLILMLKVFTAPGNYLENNQNFQSGGSHYQLWWGAPVMAACYNLDPLLSLVKTWSHRLLGEVRRSEAEVSFGCSKNGMTLNPAINEGLNGASGSWDRQDKRVEQ